MKRIMHALAVCCILSLLFLAACSSPEQSQTQGSDTLETTEEGPSYGRIIMQNNAIIGYPLTGSEPEEIREQSRFLQKGGFEGMTEEAADVLADLFIRCQRLDEQISKSNIVNARYEVYWNTYENGDMSKYEYWILTASSGTEYWFRVYTDVNFVVRFIYRDSPEGEILYGYFM